MMLQAGQQVGSYRIVSEIAQGAYANIYKASHYMFTERIVALKLLYTTFVGTEGQADILSQEAHILEHLQHPHILAIVDFNVYEGYPYIVKEYAPNGSLRERLRRLRGRPMPTADALLLLHQISDGLQFAHEQRVVHCDLKPENILFNAQDEALIADFDIAQVLKTAHSQASSIGGTPSYMAPEQFYGKVFSTSDQYALACMAYEMLTGKRPFESQDQAELRHMHQQEDPVPPTQMNPALPQHMDQALLRGLAKDHRDRFPNVAAFMAALDPIQDPSAASQWAYIPSGGQKLILSSQSGHAKGKKKDDIVAEEIYYEDTVALSADEIAAISSVPARVPRQRRSANKSATAASTPRGAHHAKSSSITSRTTKKQVHDKAEKPASSRSKVSDAGHKASHVTKAVTPRSTSKSARSASASTAGKKSAPKTREDAVSSPKKGVVSHSSSAKASAKSATAAPARKRSVSQAVTGAKKTTRTTKKSSANKASRGE